MAGEKKQMNKKNHSTHNKLNAAIATLLYPFNDPNCSAELNQLKKEVVQLSLDLDRVNKQHDALLDIEQIFKDANLKLYPSFEQDYDDINTDLDKLDNQFSCRLAELILLSGKEILVAADSFQNKTSVVPNAEKKKDALAYAEAKSGFAVPANNSYSTRNIYDPLSLALNLEMCNGSGSFGI